MELRFQEWIPDLFGLQSMAQYGVQAAQYQSVDGNSISCSTVLGPTPPGFEAVSMAVVQNNLAVMPAEWTSGGVGKPWFSIETHSDLGECMTKISEASFTVLHQDFLDFIGTEAKLEVIHKFSGIDAEHVHEAPAFIPETNELLFADTSVIGWLWALEVDTHQIRKINTSPPLPNVNGATTLDSRVYLTTNGGPTPGIWNCTSPVSSSSSSSAHQPTIHCHPLVNNFRLKHLNSPNDLIFTPAAPDRAILFTDPTYGYDQAWPGVPSPELPTAIYHFAPATGLLTALDNALVGQPNGLALSTDARTLYVADSNSTSARPVRTWDRSVRDVYAFAYDAAARRLGPGRLVHVVESGWPDGVRVTVAGGRDVLLVASMGGVDVVDVQGGGAGVLLGKFNVGEDIVFNLERVSSAAGGGQTWLLTGRKGVYRVTIRPN